MPHQFLHHLQFRTRCTEKCRVGSAKCVPTNPLCDAQPLRRGADVVTKKLLSPIWVFPRFLGLANTQLSGVRNVFCGASPQGTDQIIVERYGFCEASVLQLPTTCCTIDRLTQSCLFLKATSFHLRAHSPLCLNPVAT